MRIIAESGLEETEWAQASFDQLNLIKGKRLAAMSNGRLYKRRMKNAFDKKVCPCEFSEGDLVTKKVSYVQKDFRGKWALNYEGPFLVKKAFSGGALLLTKMDGEELPSLVNSDIVKQYYMYGFTERCLPRSLIEWGSKIEQINLNNICTIIT